MKPHKDQKLNHLDLQIDQFTDANVTAWKKDSFFPYFN